MTPEELREIWGERDKRYAARRLVLSGLEVTTIKEFRRREVWQFLAAVTERGHLLSEVETWSPPR